MLQDFHFVRSQVDHQRNNFLVVHLRPLKKENNIYIYIRMQRTEIYLQYKDVILHNFDEPTPLFKIILKPRQRSDFSIIGVLKALYIYRMFGRS